jgi:hypothetical protein
MRAYQNPDATSSGAAVKFSSTSRGNRRRFEMNALLTVYFSLGASFAGLGLLKLQARLERWSYERHVGD